MADERDRHGDAPCVLIVDDNAFWTKALQSQVRQLVDTEVAEGVGEAMGVVRRRGLPAGAALDIRLDDGCGFELLERLQALAGRRVRALIVTGWSDVDSDLRRSAARLGADFLHKSSPARAIRRKMVFLAYGAETWQALEHASAGTRTRNTRPRGHASAGTRTRSSTGRYPRTGTREVRLDFSLVPGFSPRSFRFGLGRHPSPRVSRGDAG